MAYPPFVNGSPPVLRLSEYDAAEWAATTCLDHRNNKYVVVIMEQPETVVAEIAPQDHATLDAIFRSAHAQHAQQK